MSNNERKERLKKSKQTKRPYEQAKQYYKNVSNRISRFLENSHTMSCALFILMLIDCISFAYLYFEYVKNLGAVLSVYGFVIFIVTAIITLLSAFVNDKVKIQSLIGFTSALLGTQAIFISLYPFILK